MNIGSIELKLKAIDALKVFYESDNGHTKLMTSRARVEQFHKIPKLIEIKIWVDSDAYEEETTEAK